MVASNSSRHAMRLSLWFDGALHGGGGSGGGAGAVVLAERRPLWQGARYLERPGCSSMEAEYEGLILGLRAATDLARDGISPDSVEVHGDCKILVRQMRGEIVARKTAPLQREAARCAEGLSEALSAPVYYHYVPRAANCWADALARGAIDAFTAAYSADTLALSRSGQRREALVTLRLARSRGAPCSDDILAEVLSFCKAEADWPTYLDAYREAKAVGSPLARLDSHAETALIAFEAMGIRRGREMAEIRRQLRSSAKRAAAIGAPVVYDAAAAWPPYRLSHSMSWLSQRGLPEMAPWRQLVSVEAGGVAVLRGKGTNVDARARLAEKLSRPSGLGVSMNTLASFPSFPASLGDP